jgi:5-methylcytosine-specific restriction endonuclease McrA
MPGANIHHIVSRGAGGSDSYDNLIALCYNHHAEIHAMGRATFARRYPAVEKLRRFIDDDTSSAH